MTESKHIIHQKAVIRMQKGRWWQYEACLRLADEGCIKTFMHEPKYAPTPEDKEEYTDAGDLFVPLSPDPPAMVEIKSFDRIFPEDPGMFTELTNLVMGPVPVMNRHFERGEYPDFIIFVSRHLNNHGYYEMYWCDFKEVWESRLLPAGHPERVMYIREVSNKYQYTVSMRAVKPFYQLVERLRELQSVQLRGEIARNKEEVLNRILKERDEHYSSWKGKHPSRADRKSNLTSQRA